MIGIASVGHKPLWDEIYCGESKDDAPDNRNVVLIYRNAVYVTRMYGVVGGGEP
jgi:hypothetical protein